MNVVLFAAVAISLFSLGSAYVLLRRLKDWRHGFLAAMTIFVAVIILIQGSVHFLSASFDWRVQQIDHQLCQS